MYAVDYLALACGEDNVRAAPHNFDNEGEVDSVAQLVGGLEIEVEYALKAVLTDICEPARRKMLAHEHTEHRRGLGVFYLLRGQVDARRA